MQKKKNVVTPVVAENTQESVMALPPELSNTNGTKKKSEKKSFVLFRFIQRIPPF